MTSDARNTNSTKPADAKNSDLEAVYRDLVILLSALADRRHQPALRRDIEKLGQLAAQKAPAAVLADLGTRLKGFAQSPAPRQKIISGGYVPPKMEPGRLVPGPAADGQRDSLPHLLFEILDLSPFQEIKDERRQLKENWQTGHLAGPVMPPLQALLKKFVILNAVERKQLLNLIKNIASALEAAHDELISNLEISRRYRLTTENAFQETIKQELAELDSIIGAPPGANQFTASCELAGLLAGIEARIMAIKNELKRKQQENSSRLAAITWERNRVEKRLSETRHRYQRFFAAHHPLPGDAAPLKQLPFKDPLTGAYNRQAYDRQLFKLLTDFELELLETFSLIAYNIDDFWKLNQNYGQGAADKILVHITGLAQETLRKSDQLFRYGGDEFVILLPEAPLETAIMVAEKIRLGLFQTEFKLYKNKEITIRLTLSLGITQVAGGDTQDELLARADQALYLAKRNGGNQVGAADKGGPTVHLAPAGLKWDQGGGHTGGG